MLKLDIGFLSTSLAIFMNNQDPQTPRKTTKNGVKNLNELKPHLNFISFTANPLQQSRYGKIGSPER